MIFYRMSRTVFIEAALNGPWSQSRQPLMPVTTSDLITDGINCAKAGASIIHINDMTLTLANSLKILTLTGLL